jgi:hypothetical protein
MVENNKPAAEWAWCIHRSAGVNNEQVCTVYCQTTRMYFISTIHNSCDAVEAAQLQNRKKTKKEKKLKRKQSFSQQKGKKVYDHPFQQKEKEKKWHRENGGCGTRHARHPRSHAVHLLWTIEFVPDGHCQAPVGLGWSTRAQRAARARGCRAAPRDEFFLLCPLFLRCFFSLFFFFFFSWMAPVHHSCPWLHSNIKK